MDIDPEDAEFNRWMDLLETTPVAIDLPLDMPKAVSWLHVGSSDEGANFDFLRDHLVDVEDDAIRWLSEASGAPAYRAVPGQKIRGVRLPFPIGARGGFAAGPGTGIPEDLDSYTFVIKIAQVGTTVVTCLGFAEDVEYNLPASLVPDDWGELDEWASGGPASFVHSLLSSVLLDIAWHHTAVQTSLDKGWRKWSAAYRLDDITKTESYVAQVSIQRSAANDEKQWFPDESRPQALKTDRAFAIAVERLNIVREQVRDEIQLDTIKASSDLAATEARAARSREEDAESRERLTRRLTMATALFLPATVVTAILGSNWAVSPFGGGWAGLGTVTLMAMAASAVFGLGVYIMQRRQPPRSVDVAEAATVDDKLYRAEADTPQPSISGS